MSKLIFKGDPGLHVMVDLGKITLIFDDKGELALSEDHPAIERLKVHFAILEPKTLKCSKCDFVTENKGDLLAHYRLNHPKDENKEGK